MTRTGKSPFSVILERVSNSGPDFAESLKNRLNTVVKGSQWRISSTFKFVLCKLPLLCPFCWFNSIQLFEKNCLILQF